MGESVAVTLTFFENRPIMSFKGKHRYLKALPYSNELIAEEEAEIRGIIADMEGAVSGGTAVHPRLGGRAITRLVRRLHCHIALHISMAQYCCASVRLWALRKPDLPSPLPIPSFPCFGNGWAFIGRSPLWHRAT